MRLLAAFEVAIADSAVAITTISIAAVRAFIIAAAMLIEIDYL